MDGHSLLIHETFQQTIQGEGFWAGALVDFIRLGGCPVKCPWCDTGYADGGKGIQFTRRTIAELMAELRSPRVVISGGEPFVQPTLPILVERLLASHAVSIETSGAVWMEIPSGAWITLSPKEHVSKYPVAPEFWHSANEIKLVISTGEEVDFYRKQLDKKPFVFLQPEWSEKERTIPLTIDLLKQNPSFRLSVQTHKYIGVQ